MSSWDRAVRNILIDPGMYIATGARTDISKHKKFGRNPNISTVSDPEDVWEGGGLYTGQPNNFTAETIEVFSDSANDTSAGTGLRTLQLIGLGPNFESQTEDVTLNGLTVVETTKTWQRMPRMRGLTAGSNEANEGTITARASGTTSVVFATMAPGSNRTAICAFTVPLGKKCYIQKSYQSAQRALSSWAAFKLLTREPGGLFEVRDFLDIPSEAGRSPAEHGFILPALTDVVLRVEEVSTNDMAVSGTIHYILLDEGIVL